MAGFKLARETILLIVGIMILPFALTVAGENGIQVSGEPTKIAGGNGEFFMAPKYSPDGSKIAFTQPRYRGLWVMDVDNGEVEQITDEESAGFRFSWSADSESILARVSRYEALHRYTAIKIFNVTDRSETVVTDYRRNITGVPQWSAGEEAIIINTRQGPEVQPSPRSTEVNVNQNRENDLQAFTLDESIAIHDAVTSDIQSIQPLGEASYINVTLSPDKSKIAFELVGGNMYVMNADGSDIIDLGHGHRPQWSPDGEYIVYMVTEDDGHNYTASDIYAVRNDGTGETRITDDPARLFMNPSWSPDGEHIVFNDMGDGNIYTIQIVYE